MRKIVGALVLVTLAACGGGGNGMTVRQTCTRFINLTNEAAYSTGSTDGIVDAVRGVADADSNGSAEQEAAKVDAQIAVTEIDGGILGGDDTLMTVYQDCLAT